MANVKKILSEEVITRMINVGWNINQLNTVAQMCFDEVSCGTHGPVEPFSSDEAAYNHILNHVETINGKIVKNLSKDELTMMLMGNRIIAHDYMNAQIVKDPTTGIGMRRYYPEGSSSPFLVENCYEAIWSNFDESWKMSPDNTFDYTDLQPEIKKNVFNQLYEIINDVYDYMNK